MAFTMALPTAAVDSHGCISRIFLGFLGISWPVLRSFMILKFWGMFKKTLGKCSKKFWGTFQKLQGNVQEDLGKFSRRFWGIFKILENL